MKFKLIIIIYIMMASSLFASEKVPWRNLPFPNVPRISAEQALLLKKSGTPLVIIDVAWSKEGYKKEHVCGAYGITTGQLKEAFLDRIIKKIPRNYIILSYCK